MEKYLFEKIQFECLLDAMILKMTKTNPIERSENWESQYKKLKWMKKFLDRMAYIYAENDLLRKRILNTETEVLSLKQELLEVLDELENLKNNLK